LLYVRLYVKFGVCTRVGYIPSDDFKLLYDSLTVLSVVYWMKQVEVWTS